jgi:poly(hydroxyalkanoate) granule-associated protein
MAKKLSDTANDHDQQLAQAVRTSAQQIWQAGLGAFFKAQKEEQAAAGGGEKAFQQLVEEGSVLQQRVRATSEPEQPEAGHETGQEMGREMDDAAPAARSWDKLEQVFEDRVVRALGAIGVPSKRDIDALHGQIALLREQVAQLQARLDAPK